MQGASARRWGVSVAEGKPCPVREAQRGHELMLVETAEWPARSQVLLEAQWGECLCRPLGELCGRVSRSPLRTSVASCVEVGWGMSYSRGGPGLLSPGC